MKRTERWKKEMQRRVYEARLRQLQASQQQEQQSGSAQRIKDWAIYNEKLRGLAG